MRKVFKIFRRDAGRIWSNVVAVVVVMGLCVLPSLYAWFNILSNWDPYGPESTSHLKVAVVNEDRGADLGGGRLNIGNIVIDKLKGNASIGWQFVESREKAKEGVTSGAYYAALVIDPHFSADMLSFLGVGLKHPKIDYYENEKKNAIAPKITGKVKNTVQQEVNRAFVSSIAKGVLVAGKYLEDTEGETPLTDSAIRQMGEVNADLTSSIRLMQTFIDLTASAEEAQEAGKTLQKELQQVKQDMKKHAAEAEARAKVLSLQAGEEKGGEEGVGTDEALSLLEETTEYLETLRDQLEQGRAVDEPEIDRIEEKLKQLDERVSAAFSGVSLPPPGLQARLNARLAAFHHQISVLITRLDGIKAFSRSGQSVVALSKQASAGCADLLSATRDLAEEYRTDLRPEMDDSAEAIKSSITESAKLLASADSNLEEMNRILGSAPDLAGGARKDLIRIKANLVAIQNKLQAQRTMLTKIRSSNQYHVVLKLLASDPDRIAELVSSPVGLETEALYPIENNGSAMSAFYVILSIWVGALIQVAIIHARQKHPGEISGVKYDHEYFGRYLLFFGIGQVQTLIVVLGTLYYVRIQVVSAFRFYLASAVASFVFTFVLYSLAYAFGEVGEALGVIVMVVQVAGSGGTFPVEVLPKFYRVLYPFMPFRYGMNALRECIAGFYPHAYAKNMVALLLFVLPALVIGLICSRLMQGLGEKIEASKAGSDLWV